MSPGRPKGSKSNTAWMLELRDEINPETGNTFGYDMVMASIKEAIAGNVSHLAEFMNRTEGKVPNALDLTTKGESMNADVNKQEAEHRLAALLDKISRRVDGE